MQGSTLKKHPNNVRSYMVILLSKKLVEILRSFLPTSLALYCDYFSQEKEVISDLAIKNTTMSHFIHFF